MNNQEILDQLIEIACPLPCRGYVDETGWHELCIKKAIAAMRILMDYPRVHDWLDSL